MLIFSTASPSDVPLSILSDHSFGVSSVTFSDDSRWLCTLGNSHDGFILIYSINAKTGSARLHSSNKCSNVSRVTWMYVFSESISPLLNFILSPETCLGSSLPKRVPRLALPHQISRIDSETTLQGPERS